MRVPLLLKPARSIDVEPDVSSNGHHATIPDGGRTQLSGASHLRVFVTVTIDSVPAAIVTDAEAAGFHPSGKCHCT